MSNLSAQVYFVQEDFENGEFPNEWSQTTNATDGGWLVGTNTELQSGDFPIPATSQMLVTNEDKCDCDKSVDYLIFPEMDLNNYSTIFFKADFLYFQGTYQGAQESLSFVYRNNEADNWTVLQSIGPNTIQGWETRTFDISEIAGESNVELGIHYNDGNGWTFGCGLDNVSIYEPAEAEAELTALDIDPYVQIPNTVSIEGTVTNLGLNPITSIEIMWTDGTNEYNDVINGLNIASLESYDFVLSDEFVSSTVGETNITVTIVNVNSSPDADDSNNSASSSITALEQFVSKTPLYEHFTSNTCGPCASFNPGFQTLLDQNQANTSANNVNGIKYQVNWPGAADQSFNSDVGTRVTHYNVGGVPSPYLDGVSASGNQQEIDAASNNPGLVSLSGTAQVEGESISVSVNVESFVDVNATIHIAVVEKEYQNSLGTNGESEFFQVLRKLLPSANGTTRNLTSGATETIEASYDFTVGSVVANTFNLWEGLNNCEVIAFVQNNSDKSIMQSSYLDYTSSIKTSTINDFSVYPNPANSLATIAFNLTNSSNVSLDLVNILGESVKSESYYMDSGNNFINLDVSTLTNGFYFAHLTVDGETSTIKITVTK